MGQFEPGISLYSVFMTGNDCRKRAEAARQAATRHRRDRDIWLLIAEKYDRLADDLDRLDTRAFKKVSTSTNAEQMS